MSDFLTYDFYQKEYLGNVIEATNFTRLARRAWSFLVYYTRGRVNSFSDSEAVLMAACALAEQFQIIERSQAAISGENGEIQSQTVGAYSVTYRSGADVSDSARAQLAEIARQYLANTGLLYRGGCFRLEELKAVDHDSGIQFYVKG